MGGSLEPIGGGIMYSNIKVCYRKACEELRLQYVASTVSLYNKDLGKREIIGTEIDFSV